MASYEKSIEREGKWNNLSLKADPTNQSRMSDTKGKPSMGETSHTVRIWKSPCWYEGSMKAELLFTMTVH